MEFAYLVSCKYKKKDFWLLDGCSSDLHFDKLDNFDLRNQGHKLRNSLDPNYILILPLSCPLKIGGIQLQDIAYKQTFCSENILVIHMK